MALRRWAIILAAGDGARVSGITRDGNGHRQPKQYWAPGDTGPMLRWAFDRAKRLTRPARIVTVVAAHHQKWWGDLVPASMMGGMLAQPANRGTGPGVLMPLLYVARKRRDAVVALLPADHYVADEATLAGSLIHAFLAVERGRRVVLLGMAPSGPETDYGWIVAGEAEEDGTRSVLSFVEKPGPRAARELYRMGASISSFILVGRVAALLALFQSAAPWLLTSFAHVPEGAIAPSPTSLDALEALYASIPHLDFSRDVLQRSAAHLRVIAVPPCGWVDLGDPDRLERWIRSRGDGEAGTRALQHSS